MAAQKKVLTKGQIVTHFAEKFEVSKKVAASMIDEVAATGNKPDAVLLAVGGGGLLAGVMEGLARNGWDDVPVLAAETEGAASLHAAMQAGEADVWSGPALKEAPSLEKGGFALKIGVGGFYSDIIPNNVTEGSVFKDPQVRQGRSPEEPVQRYHQRPRIISQRPPGNIPGFRSGR